MNKPGIFIVLALIGFSQITPTLVILSLKSDARIAKQQISVLQKFVERDSLQVDILKRHNELFKNQKEWNLTSTQIDSLIHIRLSRLEKLAKEYKIISIPWNEWRGYPTSTFEVPVNDVITLPPVGAPQAGWIPYRYADKIIWLDPKVPFEKQLSEL